MILWLIKLSVYCFVFSTVLPRADQAEAGLPSIWGQGQDGSGTDESAYRIRAQLQLSHSGQSFILEEWASDVLDSFRLDLIEACQGRRSSYLIYRNTNETFHYEPFKCHLISGLDQHLVPALADKLQAREMRHELNALGVGSLWLHALRMSDKVAARMSCPAGHEHVAHDCLQSYQVPATENYRYNLTLNFRGANLDDLASIQVHKPDGMDGALMEINVLEFERSLGPTMRESPDLFALPLGYGCQRSQQVEANHQLEPVPEALPNHLEAQLLGLQIVAQLPDDESLLDDFHQWRSHSASASVAMGRLRLGQLEHRDYMSLETRELVPDARLAHRRATWESRRQVWDLGRAGLSLERGVDKMRPLQYKLDAGRNKCLEFGETLEKVAPSIGLFAGQTNQTKLSNVVGLPRAIVLDEPLLRLLFGPADGYHQLRQGTSPNKASFRELVYERRLERYEMHNQAGELVWSGPVSIVRKHLEAPEEARKSPGVGGESAPEVSATLHFLAAELDQLVARVQVTLGERRLIHQAALHELLQVGACLESPAGEQVNFRVNYPLDSEAEADRVWDHGPLREQFLKALYNVSMGRLDPLQVDGIALEVVDASLLRVSGRLQNRPNLLDYQRLPGLQFSSAHQSLLFQELQADEAACADSCAHYQCPGFEYCRNSQLCSLLLGSHELKSLARSPEGGQRTCRLFQRRDATRRPAIRAPEMAELLREAVARTEAEVRDPLGLWIYSGGEHRQHMTPSSLEATQESAGLRSEHELILASRRFARPEAASAWFPVPVAEHLSYGECSELCDQLDCKSFAHCQLDNTCQVSLLHDTSIIREHSQPEDYCAIYARDWFSKFARPLRVAPPADARPGGLRVGGARDCAARCMNERQFKCRSFLQCGAAASVAAAASGQQPGGANNCFLSGRHLVGDAATVQGSGSSSGDAAPNGTVCQLYTRSYLADFDTFYARALPEVADEASVVKLGLSAEACGLECAERSSGGGGGGGSSCQAFHVCRTRHPARLARPICVLRLAPEAAAAADQWRALSAQELIANDNCTAFILAQDSELKNAAQDSRIEPSSGDAIDALGPRSIGDGGDGEEKSSRLAVSSKVISLMLMTVAALAVGYLATVALLQLSRRRRRL